MKQLTHKIRLVPNKTQEIGLNKTVGTSRYAYNWALTEWNKTYDVYKLDKANNPKPNAYDLSTRWTQEKPEWASETARDAQGRAIMDLGKAYISFWNGKTGHPTYHKKGQRDSFYIQNSKGAVKGKSIRIPKVGWIKMREELRFEGKIMSYTVTKKAGQWHVSIQVELPETKSSKKSKVGVDVGINKIAVSSDGGICENPKHLKAKQNKLKKLSKRLARQKIGSNRRNVTKTRIAKTYLDISNRRNDAIHKFTSQFPRITE